jgi:rhomboid protease GluP
MYTVIRANWLTRNIDSTSAASAALTTLAMALGALLFWNNTWNAENWMAATRDQVIVHHEWWRAWTTLVVHADLRHLLSNSLLFFILGTFLYGYFGWIAFPFLPFVMGGLTNIYVLNGMRDTTELIGVSGAVFWMGGFWLVLYLMIDRRRSLTQRALRATGVGLALFMPAEAFDPSISYESHLVGFLSGLLCASIFYFFNRRKFQTAEVKEIVFDDGDEGLN